jgi:hypothetical protein
MILGMPGPRRCGCLKTGVMRQQRGACFGCGARGGYFLRLTRPTLTRLLAGNRFFAAHFTERYAGEAQLQGVSSVVDIAAVALSIDERCKNSPSRVRR